MNDTDANIGCLLAMLLFCGLFGLLGILVDWAAARIRKRAEELSREGERGTTCRR